MQERTYLLYTYLKESDGVKMSKEYNCPVDATISKIGGKYKAVILYHLENCTLRYNEIRKRIPSITDKMLAQQLIPALKIGREWRISRQYLEDFLRNNMI